MIKFCEYIYLKKLLNVNLKLQYLRVSLHSVQLAYSAFGDDTATPPLIIQHGLFGNKNNWRKICLGLKNKLQPKRKIYAVDTRNHGNSPHTPEHTYPHLANDLKSFIEQRSINKASFLGHSMGGRAVMYLALKYPNLVERAIIVDVSPINVPINVTEYKEILGALRNVELPSNISLQQGRSKAKDQMRKTIHSEFVLNFLLLNLKKTKSGSFTWSINVETLDNYIETIAIFPEDILSNRFPNEVLFIAGKRSKFVDPKDEPAIQEIFPKSQLAWVNSGHLVHVEQPKETITLISNFLNN